MHCVNEQSMPFFLLFAVKNAEYDSFNQRLECAALKRWSKYTTAICYLPNGFACRGDEGETNSNSSPCSEMFASMDLLIDVHTSKAANSSHKSKGMQNPVKLNLFLQFNILM